jgi:hypothetical protein
MTPTEMSESLWFLYPQCCGGTHEILERNAFAAPGQMLCWCPTRQDTRLVSTADMAERAAATHFWVQGYLSGSTPEMPDEPDTDEQDSEAAAAVEAAEQRLHLAAVRFCETGIWDTSDAVLDQVCRICAAWAAGEPPPVDAQLWFTVPECCDRPHSLLPGNPQTSVGRMQSWCPTEHHNLYVSKGEMETCSEATRQWVRGFLVGAMPAPPRAADGSVLPPDHAEVVWWQAATTLFLHSGVWSDRPASCEQCGVALLPSQPDSRCPACIAREEARCALMVACDTASPQTPGGRHRPGFWPHFVARLHEQEAPAISTAGAVRHWWVRHRRVCPIHAPAERCAIIQQMDAEWPRLQPDGPVQERTGGQVIGADNFPRPGGAWDYWSEAHRRVREREGSGAPSYAELKLDWWPEHRRACPLHQPGTQVVPDSGGAADTPLRASDDVQGGAADADAQDDRSPATAHPGDAAGHPPSARAQSSCDQH